MPEPIKIAPRDIVMRVISYLAEVTPPTQKVSEMRLEELEPVDEGKYWKVVLSYDITGDYPFDKKREYKEFKSDATTGEVQSMKIMKV